MARVLKLIERVGRGWAVSSFEEQGRCVDRVGGSWGEGLESLRPAASSSGPGLAGGGQDTDSGVVRSVAKHLLV